MLIGVPKEIKAHEYRVGLTPESVRELVAHGHRVVVEKDAGTGIGATDADYREAGADVAAKPEDVFGAAELIVKVKEPLAAERSWLHAGQALFTYLHLAPDPQQTADLVKSGIVAIAYETVTAPAGGLPLLAPMSAVAGRMSIQVAAHYLERPHGARGMLISGGAGMPPARILILGAGVVGSNAVLIAVGVGGEVTVLNRSSPPLQRLAAKFGSRLKTMVSAG
ncbi:MAG: alanine dehydrogenase, partial [Pseudomonadota bacterium]